LPIRSWSRAGQPDTFLALSPVLGRDPALGSFARFIAHSTRYSMFGAHSNSICVRRRARTRSASPIRAAQRSELGPRRQSAQRNAANFARERNRPSPMAF